MNIQRFTAPTAREALAKARMAFGDGTLILSNRQAPQGVEVMATSEDTLAALATLDQSVAAPAAQPAAARAASPAARVRPAPAAAPASTPAALRAAAQTPVEEDAEQLAMSTLSFQDYVRERMLQRRVEAQQARFAAAPRPAYEVIPPDPESAPAPVRKSAPITVPQPVASAPAPASAVPQGLVNELSAMKEMIEERFSTLAWLGQTKQSPIRANLTLKLIRAGYSPALARAVLSMLPDDASPAAAVQWLMGILTRNIKTDAGSLALKDEGGVFALVGTTGVGKTTTAAKLAALCARTHGASSVGLITLDSYRIGAHEQLRAYGRMLGVVAHMAQDRAALQDLLNLLSNRKMVIIDTTGVAPRDPRKRDILDVLDLPQIRRLLVLNAASHGDTQDEAVTHFGAKQAVLTKVDEAVKIGPALDSVIRHHLVLRGVSGGQRVPEDWERADAAQLVRLSMRSAGKSAHDPQMDELGLYFAQAGTHHAAQGRLHA
ncbi:MAG: flagellar biosynthesis protein FlhF [Curvibacter sp.]|jgi:flagellar biosynthesis protein FlhF|nr:flagellar biosynthesis protein FlhF [Curvibacter sp.]